MHLKCSCGAELVADDMFGTVLGSEFNKVHAKCAERSRRKKGDRDRPYLISAGLLDRILNDTPVADDPRSVAAFERITDALETEMREQE